MSFEIVSAMEDDTGDGLLSEVLSIPMLIRGNSGTPLVTSPSTTKLLDRDVILPFPTLSSSDRGRAGLLSGTILGRFLPEILR